jgi:transcriptional regulator with XRE-family HTH domain
MNKILFVARKAKGFTEKEVARELGVEESEYLELECNFKRLPIDMLDKLEELYDIPIEYFLLYDLFDVEERIDALRQYKLALSRGGEQKFTASTHFGIAKMGIEGLIAYEHLKVSLLKQAELERENLVLRQLYMSIKKPGTQSPKKEY